MFDHSFPACASVFLCFEVEISSRALIPLFMPGSVHSSSASWDDCGPMFPDKLRVNSFPDSFPTLCLDSGIVSPLRLRWVKVVCVFSWNFPPALLAEWPGSFTFHCGNTGVERTPNKSHHTKLTLEKNVLPPLLPGFELATFRSRIRRSCQVIQWQRWTTRGSGRGDKLYSRQSLYLVPLRTSWVVFRLHQSGHRDAYDRSHIRVRVEGKFAVCSLPFLFTKIDKLFCTNLL